MQSSRVPVKDSRGERFRVFYPQAQQPARTAGSSRTVKTPRRMPTLPQELLDHILSHIHGNKRAIDSCSLVCRAWAKATARLLFSELRWPKCRHWWTDPLAADARPAICTCGESDLLSLTNFLRTAPRVCDAVLDLQISFKRAERLPIGRAATTVMPLYVDRLVTVLDALPKVRRVALRSFLDAQTALKSPVPAQRRGRQLDALTFDRTIFDPLVAKTLVNYFERIGKLTIEHPRNGPVVWQTKGTPTRPGPRTRVELLEIKSTAPADNVVCIKALEAVMSPAYIKTLHIGQVATEANRLALEDLVEDASSLQSLRFHVILWSSAFADLVSKQPTRERLLAGAPSDWASAIPLFDGTSPAPTTLSSLYIAIHVCGDDAISGRAAEDEVFGCLQQLDWSLLDGVASRLEHLERICLSLITLGRIDVERAGERLMDILRKRVVGRAFDMVEIVVV